MLNRQKKRRFFVCRMKKLLLLRHRPLMLSSRFAAPEQFNSTAAKGFRVVLRLAVERVIKSTVVLLLLDEILFKCDKYPRSTRPMGINMVPALAMQKNHILRHLVFSSTSSPLNSSSVEVKFCRKLTGLGARAVSGTARFHLLAGEVLIRGALRVREKSPSFAV